MTSGTYPWSFVTRIFHNGQPSHGGDRQTVKFCLLRPSYICNWLTEYFMTMVHLCQLYGRKMESIHSNTIPCRL